MTDATALRTSAQGTPADVAIRPRDIPFYRDGVAGSAGLDRWAGSLAETHYMNAMSMTFPEGERFFIDSVKHFRSLATGKLAEDVRNFITQESLHTREHVAFNQHLDPAHYPVAEIEQFVARRTGLARKLPRVMQLTITTILEHFTAIMAEDALRHPERFSTAPENVRRLWLWHAVEEMEHKAVAFDVWRLATAKWSGLRRYFARARGILISTVMFNWTVTTIALMLMKADGVTGLRARTALYGYMFGPKGPYAGVLRNYVKWFRPGFHPWDIDDRALLAEWRPVFDAAADASKAA